MGWASSTASANLVTGPRSTTITWLPVDLPTRLVMSGSIPSAEGAVIRLSRRPAITPALRGSYRTARWTPRGPSRGGVDLPVDGRFDLGQHLDVVCQPRHEAVLGDAEVHPEQLGGLVELVQHRVAVHEQLSGGGVQVPPVRDVREHDGQQV